MHFALDSLRSLISLIDIYLNAYGFSSFFEITTSYISTIMFSDFYFETLKLFILSFFFKFL